MHPKPVTMRPDAIRVELSQTEWAVATTVGAIRHLKSFRDGRKPSHEYNREFWTDNMEGACGELAVAKAFRLYWAGSVDTFRTIPDVGRLEVRTTSYQTGRLIHRPNEAPDRPFVLLTGRSPAFIIRGWILGEDARRAEWWDDPNGRPPAWFVPQDALRPMAELELRNRRFRP